MANDSRLMKRLISERSKRGGIATLELVFILPILMLLMAMIFSIAFAWQARAGVTAEARHEAWKKRSAAPRATRPFAFAGTATAGRVEAEARGQVKVFPWKSSPRQIRVRHVLLAGSWDHREITGFAGDGPHVDVLRQLATAQGAGISPAVVGVMQALTILTRRF